MTRKLTLNYGVRYDLELSPLFAPATSINAAARRQEAAGHGLRRAKSRTRSVKAAPVRALLRISVK